MNGAEESSIKCALFRKSSPHPQLNSRYEGVACRALLSRIDQGLTTEREGDSYDGCHIAAPETESVCVSPGCEL